MKTDVIKYLNQDFSNLKVNLYAADRLFVDDLFPPNYSSISLIKNEKRLNPKDYGIIWKRPYQIVSNPKFIISEINPYGFSQGDTGNCWFISSIVSLIASKNAIINFIIPENQSFDHNDYAGIFHFRFWQFGCWIDVCVDDYLPVNDKTNELIFCSNLKHKNEFYGALLEKAYAKLHGCYDFLNYGDPKVAMSNLTGGAVCETIYLDDYLDNDEIESDDDDDDELLIENTIETVQYLNETDKYLALYNDYDKNELCELDLLWLFILKSFWMKSLLNTSFQVYKLYGFKFGLQANHTYSILEAVEISYDQKCGKKLRLLKLRNPNGNEYAWRGDWSWCSFKWNQLSEESKIKYKLSLDPTMGEFYISLQDYVKFFTVLDIAHIDLNSFYDYELFNYKKNKQEIKWQLVSFYDIWIEKINAGSLDEYYWSNSQYLIQIYENPSDPNNLTPIIISLMQPFTVRGRYENNGNYINSFASIKFDIYSVELTNFKIEQKMMNKKLFNESELKHFDSSCCYLEQKEAAKKVYLPKGIYVILPSSQNSEKNINYFIRIFYQQFSAYFLSELIFK